jgi:competence protein ComEC
VLTHFDLDHVGGVDGVLEHASIGAAMVTSFVDDRPGANYCRDELARFGIDPMAGGVGVFGTLGDFNWRVISPHLGAAEAEDSNDGSVTMIFDSPNVDIITLADLGEKGQMRLARELATWLPADYFAKPRIMKVSHHGSADQYPEFIEALKPQVALISVGLHNSYGHPTRRTLSVLRRTGAAIERTDQMGSVAISFGEHGELERSISGPMLVGSAR